MSFEIIATPRFRKDIKKLSKKYASLRTEFSILLDGLALDPRQGTMVSQPLQSVPHTLLIWFRHWYFFA